MVLIIIGLIFVAHLLFKNSERIKERIELLWPRPRPQAPDEPPV